jgi:DNA-binding CsgD family transcriptional regulator
MQSLKEFLETVDTPMNLADLLDLLDTSQNHCVFIKDEHSAYCYANLNYIRLMGLHNINQLRRLNDRDLSKNKKDADMYRELDCFVMEEGKTLSVSEQISPAHNQPIVKTMQGKLTPLYSHSDSANYVLGLVTPESKMLKLDFDTMFSLNQSELDDLLIKRSYDLSFNAHLVTLSKKEICTIIELLKGSHAGDIAKALQIKQTTVESYLANIKNKLAVSSKGELIQAVIKEKLLEQVIL